MTSKQNWNNLPSVLTHSSSSKLSVYAVIGFFIGILGLLAFGLEMRFSGAREALLRGHQAELSGETAEAIRNFTIAVRAFPFTKLQRVGHLALGDLAYHEQDYAVAEREYGLALQYQHDDSVRVYYANAAYKNNNLPRAFENFRQVSNEDGFLGMVKVYVTKKEYNSAWDLLSDAGERARFLYQLGEQGAGLSRDSALLDFTHDAIVADEFELAELALSRVSAAHQHDRDYFVGQGLIAFHRNDYSLAASFFSRAIEVDPNNAEILYFSGQVEAAQGNDVAAKTLFEKSKALGFPVP